MVTKADIRKHFLDTPKTQTNIIAFCKLEYENIARKQGELRNSNYLELLVNQVCKALGLSNPVRKKILKGLFHVMLSYRIRAGMESNKAPIFHPSQHLAAIDYLWKRKTPSVEMTFAYRLTAAQALVCLHTFRRWVDTSRIRWEHCEFVSVQNRTFLKFKLGASKTNSRGQRNEFITLQKIESEYCPVHILTQFWKISGCPRTGFVFPCIHAKRSFTTDSLYQHWDAYTCSGHKTKRSVKVACLGEVNGITSLGFYKRAAKDLKWQKLPHGHSFRRFGIVLANKMNVPRERITEFFGWKHDSSMLSHYLGDELATTSQGLAWKFADAIDQNLDCLHDISFAK